MSWGRPSGTVPWCTSPQSDSSAREPASSERTALLGTIVSSSSQPPTLLRLKEEIRWRSAQEGVPSPVVSL